jgi:hypothetical protein
VRRYPSPVLLLWQRKCGGTVSIAALRDRHNPGWIGLFTLRCSEKRQNVCAEIG